MAPPPLRYAGTSQLLRVSPPARPATVLGSLRIPPLEVLPLATNCSVTVSRRAFTCSVREPGPDSCCLYAGHHLGSRRGNPQAPPRAKTKPWFRCHLISFRRFSRQRAFRPIAHLSGPYLTRSLPRLFLHRSRPRSSAKAPVGGLKPPPARRLRRSRKLLHLLIQHRRPGTPSPTPAHVHKVFSQRSMWWFAASLRTGGYEGPNLHLLHSTMSKSSTYNRTPFHVRGTRGFSYFVSSRNALNWVDAGCLTRCPR